MCLSTTRKGGNFTCKEKLLNETGKIITQKYVFCLSSFRYIFAKSLLKNSCLCSSLAVAFHCKLLTLESRGFKRGWVTSLRSSRNTFMTLKSKCLQSSIQRAILNSTLCHFDARAAQLQRTKVDALFSKQFSKELTSSLV